MRLLLLISTLVIINTLNAQLSVEGSYRGSNLYIQNPWDEYDDYCVDSVFVNGEKYTSALEFAAFQIRLDSLGFSLNDPLEINIYHKKGCKPHVLNQPRNYQRFNIQFKDLNIDGDSLRWKANEKVLGRFEIQMYRWNKWFTIDSIQKSLNTSEFSYGIKDDLHSGENVFRITFIDALGVARPSEELKIESGLEEISYSINSKTKEIEFSSATRYEFYNQYGAIILKGKGISVKMNKLPEKIYYMNIDNTNVKLKLKH